MQSTTYNYTKNWFHLIFVSVPTSFKIAGKAYAVESLFSNKRNFCILQHCWKLYHPISLLRNSLLTGVAGLQCPGRNVAKMNFWRNFLKMLWNFGNVQDQLYNGVLFNKFEAYKLRKIRRKHLLWSPTARYGWLSLEQLH